MQTTNQTPVQIESSNHPCWRIVQGIRQRSLRSRGLPGSACV